MRLTTTLHEDVCTLVIISSWILCRINISDKTVEKIKKKTFMLNNLVSENHAVCEIM